MKISSPRKITALIASVQIDKECGFLSSEDHSKRIFFSFSDVPCDPTLLKAGGVLRGIVVQDAKGPKLTQIEVIRFKHTSPHVAYTALAILITAMLTYAVWLNFDVSSLVAYIVAINIASLFFTGLDKALARKGALRTPEVIPFCMALLGGSPGVLLGIHVFRHKTRKASFQFVLLLIVVAQFALLRALGLELRGN